MHVGWFMCSVLLLGHLKVRVSGASGGSATSRLMDLHYHERVFYLQALPASPLCHAALGTVSLTLSPANAAIHLDLPTPAAHLSTVASGGWCSPTSPVCSRHSRSDVFESVSGLVASR